MHRRSELAGTSEPTGAVDSKPAMGAADPRPAHPATIAQPRAAVGARAPRPPHPATVAQPRSATNAGVVKPRHPATVQRTTASTASAGTTQTAATSATQTAATTTSIDANALVQSVTLEYGKCKAVWAAANAKKWKLHDYNTGPSGQTSDEKKRLAITVTKAEFAKAFAVLKNKPLDLGLHHEASKNHNGVEDILIAPDVNCQGPKMNYHILVV